MEGSARRRARLDLAAAALFSALPLLGRAADFRPSGAPAAAILYSLKVAPAPNMTPP